MNKEKFLAAVKFKQKTSKLSDTFYFKSEASEKSLGYAGFIYSDKRAFAVDQIDEKGFVIIVHGYFERYFEYVTFKKLIIANSKPKTND